MSLFVNPIRLHEERAKRPASVRSSAEYLDPFRQVIESDQARSAILYGPPGTGKTTIVRAIAESVGWDFVEVPVSKFVADGYERIGQTADKLFSYLKELDRCVVLLDEIDELVRSRVQSGDQAQPEMLSRFLTTSMLPRLAELWSQRRIMYFVATNHIEFFDEAIKRAHRFDALLFVGSPAFAKKRDRLLQCVQSAFAEDWNIRFAPSLESRAGIDQGDPRLQKFVMMRWDQIEEVAHHLQDEITTGTAGRGGREWVIVEGGLSAALGKMRDDNMKDSDPMATYKQWFDTQRVDYGMKRVWEIVNLDENGAIGEAEQSVLQEAERVFRGAAAIEVFDRGDGTANRRAFVVTKNDLREDLIRENWLIQRLPDHAGCVQVKPKRVEQWPLVPARRRVAVRTDT